MNKIGLLPATALALTLLGTGCMKAFNVSTAQPSENGPLKGIPFYVVEGVCAQTTIYHENELLVELVVQHLPPVAGAPNPPPRTVLSERIKDCPGSDVLQALHKLAWDMEFGDASIDPKDELSQLLKNARAVTCEDWKSKPVLNTAQIESRVNYSKTYYYNVQRPWFGSTTADLSLNDNGTIGQAKATIDSETMDAFLDLLPISGFLTGRYIDKDIVAEVDEKKHGERLPAEKTISIELKVKPTRIEHTFSATHADKSVKACTMREPLQLNSKGGHNYRRKQIDIPMQLTKPATPSSCVSIQCSAKDKS